MKLFTACLSALASGSLVLAHPPHWNTTTIPAPTKVLPRQTIPSGYTFAVAGYPSGCGGTGEQFYGGDWDLAACTAINGIGSDSTWSAMKFEAPSNYKLRIFSGTDCSNEILLQGQDISQCFDVPEGQTAGAFIVFT